MSDLVWRNLATGNNQQGRQDNEILSEPSDAFIIPAVRGGYTYAITITIERRNAASHRGFAPMY